MLAVIRTVARAAHPHHILLVRVMIDLYCRQGLRFQNRVWLALIVAFSATATAVSSAFIANISFAVSRTLQAACYVAYVALLFGLSLVLAFSTGTLFRLGLVFSADVLRRYGPYILAAHALAPAWILLGNYTDTGTSLALILWAMASVAAVLLFTVPLVEYFLMWRHEPRGIEDKLKTLSEKHGPGALKRVALSWDLFNGRAPFNPTNSQRGWVVTGLSAKPWIEREDVPWSKLLEAGWRDTLEEYWAYSKTLDKIPDYSYPGAVTGQWNTVMLVSAMKEQPALQFFPKTRKLLEAVPHYPQFREAQISILGPKSRIKPHRDGGNFWHTCQLALSVSDVARCGIRVGGLTRHWTVGQTIFFNTSYEHEAWNDTDEVRIVLIVDYLHPELTEPECEFVTHTMSQGLRM